MTPVQSCDFKKLAAGLTESFPLGPHSDHGPHHWRRVEQNGLWLASRSGADPFVVRLFSWFHDARRENEFQDPDHGRRCAELAISLRDNWFTIDDLSFEKLISACIGHTDELHSSDPTIGTCWDADRLDLGRVGVLPSPDFMSTAFGKEVAAAGSFFPFLDEIERSRHFGSARLPAAHQVDSKTNF